MTTTNKPDNPPILVLDAQHGGVEGSHWIELPISGPRERNVLVLAAGMAVIYENGLDSNGGDPVDTQIWIETGYRFAAGDTAEIDDFSVSVQLAAVNSDGDTYAGSDDVRIAIDTVVGVPETAVELEAVLETIAQGAVAIGRLPVPPGMIAANDQLAVVLNGHVSGLGSILRLSYNAAVRLKRVDSSRVPGVVRGDRPE